MMAVVGPNLMRGLDSGTALIGFDSDRNCAILGPIPEPTVEVDAISRIFVLLGKIVAARRVVADDRLTEPKQPAAVEHFGALQAFVLDQKDTAEWELVWKPLAVQIQANAIAPLNADAATIDQRTRRFIACETHTILAIDPTATVEQRIAAINEYLLHNGFTVEASNNGFRDFIAQSFVGPDGGRINLPTSADPSFPDSWITPQVIDPQAHGSSRREWSFLW